MPASLRRPATSILSTIVRTTKERSAFWGSSKKFNELRILDWIDFKRMLVASLTQHFVERLQQCRCLRKNSRQTTNVTAQLYLALYRICRSKLPWFRIFFYWRRRKLKRCHPKTTMLRSFSCGSWQNQRKPQWQLLCWNRGGWKLISLGNNDHGSSRQSFWGGFLRLKFISTRFPKLPT